ncbi:hypothetical protein EVA_10230 [gut metagenome]|uniref:Uncharacterized protein n=1 Tax=gut metagenome TaxID=749906 RepID=J9GIA1_9ZZZZ
MTAPLKNAKKALNCVFEVATTSAFWMYRKRFLPAIRFGKQNAGLEITIEIFQKRGAKSLLFFVLGCFYFFLRRRSSSRKTSKTF